MDLNVDYPFDIFSQLLIPIFVAFLTAFIPVSITIYLSTREKNRYIKLLKIHFPIIQELTQNLKRYKSETIDNFIIIFFVFIYLGILFNSIFLYFMVIILFNDVTKDYIVKLFANYNLDMFHISLCYTSLGYVPVFVYFILTLYRNGIYPAKMIDILQNKIITRSKLPSPLVGSAHCIVIGAIIGVIVGVNISVYYILSLFLEKFSIINEQLTPDILTLQSIYIQFIEKVEYSNIYIFSYILGILCSLFLILSALEETIRLFQNEIKLITEHHKCDFPYIKIKTGSGEAEGQLRDIKHKSLVTISEKNTLKIIPWNEIQIMEVSDVNKEINQEPIILTHSDFSK